MAKSKRDDLKQRAEGRTSTPTTVRAADPTNPAGGQSAGVAFYDPAGTPIGVPRGYIAPRPTEFHAGDIFRNPGVQPLYYPGAERAIPWTLGANGLAQLQLQLRVLGAVDPKYKFTLGAWDDTFANAFTDVLGFANTQGITWQQALDQLMQRRAALPQPFFDTGAGAGAQPRPMANESDIIALGKQVGQAGIGRELTKGEQAKFNQDFRTEEAPTRPAHSQVADKGAAGWAEWGRTEVRQFDPTKFDARKVGDAARVLEQLMGGTGASDNL